MQVEIDPEVLTSDERYHLSNGLEAIICPSPSCRKLINELCRLSTKAFNKHCREHPYDWV